MKTGSELRTAREQTDVTQEQVATVLGIGVTAVRSIEQASEVDAVAAAKYARALMLLRGLRHQVSRRVARAAREAAAV